MIAVTTLEQPGRVERYEPFFGLNKAPFSLAPDTRFLFASASHSAALAQVAYALERREPLVVITGEIGSGKTLLCRTVLQELRRKTFLSVINDPLLERDDLLKQLLEDFGVISKDRAKLTEAGRHELVETLHAFLRSLAPIEAHAVVIIDEAQHLQPHVLEQIRLVSNIDDEGGTLLQIILVGQTDLEPLLSRPELRQLQQRVSRRFRLAPLTREEVAQYIQHRLALASDGKPSEAPGATGPTPDLAGRAGTNAGAEFTSDAIQAVSVLSGGLPRMVNLLCDRSLEAACASRLRIIDGPLIQAAARALGVGEQAAPASPAARVNATEGGTLVEPEESFRAVSSESEAAGNTLQPADESVPVPDGLSTRNLPAAAPRLTKYLVVASSLAAALAVWFGLRTAGPPVADAPPSVPAPASSATRGSGARRDPAPAGANSPVPEATATTGTQIAPEVTAPVPSAGVATAPGGGFDIVVASFRTDARAASAAAEVAALGLPIRRRVSDGWQQVIAGPFAARADAEEAQRRLHSAGLTGTQVVPIAR